MQQHSRACSRLLGTPIQHCDAVNNVGTYFTIDVATGVVGAVTCPVNSYGPGLKKQRAW